MDGCGRGGPGLRLVEGQAVLGRGQNVLQRAVAGRAQLLGSAARGLQPLGAVAPPETHDPQAGAVALLGMRPAAQDLGHQPARGRSGLAGPADQPRGRPLRVRPVRARHVLGLGRRPTIVAPAVGSDPLALVVDLDDRGCVAGLDVFA